MEFLKRMGVRKLNTKELVLMSLFIAMNIVLVRLLSFQTLTIRISFGFISSALAGAILGPFWAGIMGVVSDILGMMLFSKGMTYFPLYGISEFLYGFLYGLFLYGKKPAILRISLCVLIQAFIINMGLSTIWTYLYCHLFTESTKGITAIFIGRIIPALVTIPLHITVIYFLMKLLPSKFFPKTDESLQLSREQRII